LYVPEVYWDYCTPQALVQERIYGIPISDMKALQEAGTNIKTLAENGVYIFFTQVFRHNFFHADMHPGNLFVQVEDPEHPKYAAVDFGIVGSLTPTDRKYLAGNFMAFFDRDYYRIARLHIDSGWVPPGTRIDELESAVRTVCEPIFSKPLAEISFAQVTMRLLETARRFNMEVQPQLILLQKTLFNIEGLGRELYPQLDLWKTARPVLKRWMDEQVGARALLESVRENAPQIRETMRELPGVVRLLTEQAAKGQVSFNVRSTELRDLSRRIDRQQRQRFWLAVGFTAFVSGILVLSLTTAAFTGWSLLAAGIAALATGRPGRPAPRPRDIGPP
jgi:ubiquinone biosynthesis protein